MVAQTRAGKQVLNLRDGVTARVCRAVAAADDAVAVVGENRKLLVFQMDELPEMGRGKGVRLQKYKDGGLSDARSFRLENGLSWRDPAGRTRTETELAEWLGKRASAGRDGAARAFRATTASPEGGAYGPRVTGRTHPVHTACIRAGHPASGVFPRPALAGFGGEQWLHHRLVALEEMLDPLPVRGEAAGVVEPVDRPVERLMCPGAGRGGIRSGS